MRRETYLLPFHIRVRKETMKRNLEKILPNNVKAEITYTGMKVQESFQIRDETIYE